MTTLRVEEMDFWKREFLRREDSFFAEVVRTCGPVARKGEEGGVTDRDMLIALCEKLGLERADPRDFGSYRCLDDRRYVVEDGGVTLGCGEGYSGFRAEFKFDADGNVLSHGVWE